MGPGNIFEMTICKAIKLASTLSRAKIKVVAVLLCCSILAISCREKTSYKKYQALLEQEMAEGKRVDSLFFNIRLGMPSKEFYMHCWDMNKKGLFTDGESNTAVLYKLSEGLRYPASMNFYPGFYNDKISKMGVSFRYDGWAPWNKQMCSDSLKQDVLQLYEKWYPDGNSFIKLEDKDRGSIYVKVDGNRRIIIGSYNNTYVKVDYTDLFIEKQMQEAKHDQ